MHVPRRWRLSCVRQYGPHVQAVGREHGALPHVPARPRRLRQQRLFPAVFKQYLLQQRGQDRFALGLSLRPLHSDPVRPQQLVQQRSVQSQGRHDRLQRRRRRRAHMGHPHGSAAAAHRRRSPACQQVLARCAISCMLWVFSSHVAGAVSTAAALACSSPQTIRPSASTTQKTAPCLAGCARASSSILSHVPTLSRSLSGHEDCVNSIFFDSQVRFFTFLMRVIFCRATLQLAHRRLCSYQLRPTEHSKFGHSAASLALQ